MCFDGGNLRTVTWEIACTEAAGADDLESQCPSEGNENDADDDKLWAKDNRHYLGGVLIVKR